MLDKLKEPVAIEIGKYTIRVPYLAVVVAGIIALAQWGPDLATWKPVIEYVLHAAGAGLSEAGEALEGGPEPPDGT